MKIAGREKRRLEVVHRARKPEVMSELDARPKNGAFAGDLGST